MELLRGDGPVVRVGHRGAPVLAPENSLESLAAAADAGVDIVEVDVIGLSDGRVVLAHSHEELAEDAPTLDDALELVAARGIGIQLDVKEHGHERKIAAAVARYGLLERAFASSFSHATLRAFAEAEPRLRRSVTYPEDRYSLSGRALTRPFIAPSLKALRSVLPARLPRWLRQTSASAATLHWLVVSAAAIRACHAAGAAVYAWTVDDVDEVERLGALGVDGIITNDPRVFAPASTTS
jgi:glycerophosphoryl diester phosphodiesterase